MLIGLWSRRQGKARITTLVPAAQTWPSATTGGCQTCHILAITKDAWMETRAVLMSDHVCNLG